MYRWGKCEDGKMYLASMLVHSVTEHKVAIIMANGKEYKIDVN